MASKAPDKDGFAKQAKNIFNNAVAPFYGTDRIVGTSFNIAVNVLVETTLRQMVGWKKVPMFDKIAYHALSQPFIGGVLASGDYTKAGEGKMYDAFADGARGIPAVLLGQYILYTLYGGFHIPKLDMSELMVVAATKLLSRPIVSSAAAWLPKQLKDQIGVIDSIYASQMENSNLKMKE
jgi:hypothetical protein